MREYERIETPTDFPAMCICGSQKAPLVDTHLVKDAYGHIYVCLQCTKRLARALGIAKGAEMDRLENAAAELVQAAVEISTRQELIDRQTALLAQNEERLRVQGEFIEQLQGDLRLRANQVAQIAEMAAA